MMPQCPFYRYSVGECTITRERCGMYKSQVYCRGKDVVRRLLDEKEKKE